MEYCGLFVGLTTLDFIYLSDLPLQPNHKAIAQDYLTVAGGPATNAAVAFSSFGNRTKLLSVVGKHPLTALIREDLKQYNVDSSDLIPSKVESPSVSSIVVTAATGERAIISINAVKSQASFAVPSDLLNDVDLVLLDGHQLEVSLQVAAIAKQKKIPVVLDGGSWKPGLEQLLPLIDYAICSANFYPPQCQNKKAVFNSLKKQGIEHVAITQGEQPILYFDSGTHSEITVTPIKAIDTLGAGDIFHGAFCQHILEQNFDFPRALELASKVASRSCLSFGTRNWLRE